MNVDLPKEFIRLSYDEAIDLYGTDKPDLRFEMKMQDASFMAELGDFTVFKDAVSQGGAVKALVVKAQAENYSRKKIEERKPPQKSTRQRGLPGLK